MEDVKKTITKLRARPAEELVELVGELADGRLMSAQVLSGMLADCLEHLMRKAA